MRIWIWIFILILIRIWIWLLIKVMRLCSHRPHRSILNFDFDADPDPVFDFFVMWTEIRLVSL